MSVRVKLTRTMDDVWLPEGMEGTVRPDAEGYVRFRPDPAPPFWPYLESGLIVATRNGEQWSEHLPDWLEVV